jgi:hypothetical protein
MIASGNFSLSFEPSEVTNQIQLLIERVQV